MWKDEVLEEIYRIREEHAKSFNYDLQAICDNLQKRQTESGRLVISKPLKQRIILPQENQKLGVPIK